MSKKKQRAPKSKKTPKTTTEKIKSRLLVARAQKVIPLEEISQIKRQVEQNSASLKRPEEIEKEGLDPAFAVYAGVQQLFSLCAELLLQLPELSAFSKRLEQAEDEYMPSYPPMSPITASYFNMWLLCDLHIADGRETLGGMFADLGGLFGLGADHIEIVRKLVDSRMGIYEHGGYRDGLIILRELVTDKEILLYNASGYRGEQGELWFVRVAPPPAEFIPYSVGFGTPYILRAPKKNEWLEFFKRNGISAAELGFERRLEKFLKFGPEPRYWSEFIFEGYCGHNPGAIFLHGLPDMPESRPHSKEFSPLKGLTAL